MQRNRPSRRDRHPEDRPAISAEQFVAGIFAAGAAVGYALGRLRGRWSV